VEGQFPQRGPADLTRVPEHRAEIDPAGPGGRHRRAVDRARDFDGTVTRDPAVALIIKELESFHPGSLEEVRSKQERGK
jgi:hypothetical protein